MLALNTVRQTTNTHHHNHHQSRQWVEPRQRQKFRDDIIVVFGLSSSSPSPHFIDYYIQKFLSIHIHNLWWFDNWIQPNAHSCHSHCSIYLVMFLANQNKPLWNQPIFNNSPAYLSIHQSVFFFSLYHSSFAYTVQFTTTTAAYCKWCVFLVSACRSGRCCRLAEIIFP